MATELFKKGLPFDQPAEAWNLIRPEAVREVHESYLAAGARCILANTFQANAVALAKHGLKDKLEEILRAGVRLAREARGPDRYVLATIGPLGTAYDNTAFERIISSLDGVDGILLETFSDVDALWLAKYGVLPRLGEKKVPVLLSISYLKNASGTIGSRAGQSADAFASQAAQYGLNALGLNCGKGMGLADATSVIRDYRNATELPLFARPNAGTPQQTPEGLIYSLQPADFAAWVSDVMRLGIRLVGGCCGTTPATIAAMRQVLDRWSGAEEVW
jgi:methionine synthase I (cobalamin-dependent)